MSEQALIETLRNLPAVGQLIKDRGYRQVWRFELHGRGYYLKWYPSEGSRLKWLLAGSPAVTEFTRLIALQKARIPSPRAIAVLRGFTLNGRRGDAVILEAIEPSIRLDRYLEQCDLNGGIIPNRRQLAAELIDLVYSLGRARLGHADLHLGNILLSNGRLYLLDGYSVRTGGLKLRHVMMLGHSVARWASRADMVRGWRKLMATSGTPPLQNSLDSRLYRKLVRRTLRENTYFGRLNCDGFRGQFVKSMPSRRWWCPASALQVTAEDWIREWPAIRQGIEQDRFTVIKRGDSGDVLAATAHLGGTDVEIVIKLPRRKSLWKHLNSIGRRSRNRRTWIKAWKLNLRNFAAEWPLLLMEKSFAGYVTESVLIMARVPGPTLADVNLDQLAPGDRQALFLRLGRTLRRLEQAGFGHFDAKSTNWIVMPDPHRGPIPVMIDVDGVRHYRWDGKGLQRLLRAMKQHPQYTKTDSLWLCRGYAPWARVVEDG
ncbi:MAG: hypothetical protein NZ561_06785 [Phycisphaerae bacterium]|nr:hypothetical protein [Phycisphaerae bacterium]